MFGRDWLRCAGADSARTLSLGEEPGEKALTFSDSLHFDGGRLERMLHSLQSFGDLARK